MKPLTALVLLMFALVAVGCGSEPTHHLDHKIDHQIRIKIDRPSKDGGKKCGPDCPCCPQK